MKVKGFQDTIEWYNQNADQYAKATFQTASPEEIDQFAKLLSEGAKVLDAGCGCGRDTDLLSKKGLKAIGRLIFWPYKSCSQNFSRVGVY